MPRLRWDDNGSRVFETGIDRGVLYLPSLPGIPWNGLTKVSEAPSGGTAKEFYIDGEKYLSDSVLEEYAATIEAFSSPAEFAPCAGLLKISQGLYADNQPRKPFGFSYRTLVGDDIQGTSAGYKIHLVYNAMAKPSGFTYQTIGDRSSAKPYSWAITAIPELVENSRPTAHFVIDSRKTDPAALNAIENALYGSETDISRLLPVADLLVMLETIETGILDISGEIVLKKIEASGSGTAISVISGAVRLKKITVSGFDIPVSVFSGGIRLKKIRISGTGSGISSVSGNPVLKKMTVTGTGTRISFVSGAVRLKKMRVSGSATGISVASGTVGLEKLRVSGSGGPAGPLATILVFSDVQFDDGSGTNTRATAMATTLAGLSYDELIYGGDCTNAALTSQHNAWVTAFGDYKADIHPVPGNHDYIDDSGSWYWSYWGSQAGTPTSAPWYSFDVAGWHIICCDGSGAWNSLSSGSTQYTWLHNDLNANTGKPTIVVWHWGRFSASSAHGGNSSTSAAWQLLIDHGVEMLISGHQHNYERYDRLNASGTVDSVNGVRQFTVPPGGQTSSSITESGSPVPAAYAAYNVVGFLRLKLFADHYEWDVITPSGQPSYSDSGTQNIRYPI
jgi:Calcineurin-like phosphoesterase